MLGVKYGKHALIQLCKEFLQSHLQINVPVFVIILEVFEKVGENIRISLVKDPVSFLEHKVEISLGAGQQLGEEVWKIFWVKLGNVIV